MVNFRSELEGVFANYVRDVIDELHSRIRALHFRPVKSPQFLRENIEGRDVDAGQSAVERIGYTGVQAVIAGGNSVIVRKRRLVQPVVAEAGFVSPLGTRNMGPIDAGHLRPGMDLRQPFGLEFARIAHRSVVVAIKISAADGVAVVDVVVHFADCVVGAHAVGKTEVDRSGAGWIGAKIRRETAAVAGNRRAQSAAADLQAGWADRDSARL